MITTITATFSSYRRLVGRALLIAVALLLLLAPSFAFTGGYQLDVVRISFYLAILAATWSLLAGIAGQFSFAHVAIAGLGGYAAAIWSNELSSAHSVAGSVWVSILVGTAFAAIIGTLVALLLHRLQGVYLALFTVAFAEIVRYVILSESEITGGPFTLFVAPLPGTDLDYYYVVLALLFGSLAVIYWVLKSRFGVLLRAMREDVHAAAAMGVNVQRLKLGIFCLTSILIGFAASVYFHTAPRIGPDDVDLLLMSQVLAFTVIGGIESPLAAAMAAIVLWLFLQNINNIDVDHQTAVLATAVLSVIGVVLVARSVWSWRGQIEFISRAAFRPFALLGVGIALFVWFLLLQPDISQAGSFIRLSIGVVSLAALALSVGWRSRGLPSHISNTLPGLIGGLLILIMAVRMFSLGDIHLNVGVWRFAVFGTVLIATLRFAPDGLLTPVLAVFLGRESALRDAAAVRLTGSLSSGGVVRGEFSGLPRRKETNAGRHRVALRVDKLMMAFGGNLVLRDVTFAITEPQICGLIGPNGAGKSTLVNILGGLYQQTGGAILLRDERVDGLPPFEIARRGLARTFQVTRAFKRMSVIDNVIVPGLSNDTDLNSTQLRTRAMDVLASLGLEHLAHEYARALSGGQLKLLELARLMMLDPDIFVLDEPFAGVHPTLRQHIYAFIRERSNAGKAFFIVEHDMNTIFELSQRLLVLSEGTLIADGNPQVLRHDPKVIQAYLGRDEPSPDVSHTSPTSSEVVSEDWQS